MNKKAFTLAELIGVITLLAILSVLIAPTIINQIRNSKNKIDEVTEQLIFSATGNYLDSRVSIYPKKSSNVYCITLNDLVNDNKLQAPVVDASGNSIDLGTFVKVEVVSNQYSYSISKKCTPHKEENKEENKEETPTKVTNPIFTTSDENPSIPDCITNDTKCELGTPVAVQVNDEDTYNFYVIEEKNNELTLIMDQNLGSSVPWNNDTNNYHGPITALSTLESLTSNWTNIPIETYQVIDENNRYSPMTRENARARLITKSEVSTLLSLSDNSWVYENGAYWTSSTGDGVYDAWYVNSSGGVTINSTYNSLGIRPVITISKFSL